MTCATTFWCGVDACGAVGLQSVPGDASPEQIAALINDSLFGLTAGVYSSSREVAEPILELVDAGTVYWNKHGVVVCA